jgi:hypothetical protein
VDLCLYQVWKGNLTIESLRLKFALVSWDRGNNPNRPSMLIVFKLRTMGPGLMANLEVVLDQFNSEVVSRLG